MLTQIEANNLIEMLKTLRDTSKPFLFPAPGEHKVLALDSKDKKHEFLVDVNRKGSIFIATKCTYQNRYQKDIILARVDIDGPPHTNPDGNAVSGNHMHIYTEGYADKFAIELPDSFHLKNSLIENLIVFLECCKAINAPDLEVQGVI